jgi:cytochrome P450
LEFIPERFDSSSEIAKTPSGAKRHPMSFGPFLGGKRVCLGKTFAELMIKVIPSILSF